jgi:hypothetical protein
MIFPEKVMNRLPPEHFLQREDRDGRAGGVHEVIC